MLICVGKKQTLCCLGNYFLDIELVLVLWSHDCWVSSTLTSQWSANNWHYIGGGEEVAFLCDTVWVLLDKKELFNMLCLQGCWAVTWPGFCTCQEDMWVPGWMMNQIVIRDTDEEVVCSSSSSIVIAVEVKIFAGLGYHAAQIGS